MCLANDLVQIEHFRIQHLPAAEREQVPGQCGTAVSGREHALDVVGDTVVIARKARERELAVAADRDE